MKHDVSGRPLELRDLDLTLLFRPRVVAVVGASDVDGRQNTAQWRRMRDWCAQSGAEVWPVHPSKKVIDGRRAVPTLLDVPADVDLAVILIKDAQTTIEQAILKGVRFAIVFASGFAEIGGEGRDRQDRLANAVLGSDLRLLGPNTNFNAFEQFRDDLPGPKIGLITQSGHQGRPIFQSQEIGIALSAWAPTGNEVDLEFADFVRWFADQPDIGVIAAYVESFRDARTMRLAADYAVRANVPLVCVKVGRTPEGASMALSHTGKSTGTDAVVDAAFGQHGVVRVDALDQLIDTSQVLVRRPAGPVTDGVVVYSISGGTGAHMADLCSHSGLRLPTLTTETQTRLREWIPDFLRVSNPVDSGGNGAGDDRGRQLLETLIADPQVGVVICPITGAFAPMSDRLAQDLVDVAETTDKLICVVWGSPAADETAYRKILLGSSKVATFRTFGNCVRAVKAWLDWHAFRARYQSPFLTAPDNAACADAARKVLARNGHAVSAHGTKEVLAAYGISAANEQVVYSASAAVNAARALSPEGPVVLKVAVSDISDRFDGNGVRRGIAGDKAVWKAYEELASLGGGDVIVAEEIADGIAELIVGVRRDEVFGPIVTVQSGGKDAEVWGDTAVRVPPFDRLEACRMLDELKGISLLRGVRGRPVADESAAVDVILSVQMLALDLADEVRELEINPLVVRARGQGTVAVDSAIVRAW